MNKSVDELLGTQGWTEARQRITEVHRVGDARLAVARLFTAFSYLDVCLESASVEEIVDRLSPQERRQWAERIPEHLATLEALRAVCLPTGPRRLGH